MESFEAIRSRNPFTVVEGTGHCAVGSIINMSNAQVAALLGLKMIVRFFNLLHHLSIRPSIHPSAYPSIHPSIHPLCFILAVINHTHPALSAPPLFCVREFINELIFMAALRLVGASVG